MLKKVSFILAVVGISFLIGMLLIPASRLEDEGLEDLEINSKIVLEGKVVDERDFGEFKVWGFLPKLTDVSNGSVELIEVVCDCKESYLEKEVRLEGVVEEYEGERQVRVLKIRN